MYWGKNKNKQQKKQNQSALNEKNHEKNQKSINNSNDQTKNDAQQKLFQNEAEQFVNEKVLESDEIINYNENESTFTTFLIQTKALLWKNQMIFSRKMQIIYFLALTPITVCYMLSLLLMMGDGLERYGIIDNTIMPIRNLPKCDNGYHEDSFSQWIYKSFGGQQENYEQEDCVTVGYGFIGDINNINAPEYQRFHDIMKIFSKLNNFEYGKDVKALTVGKQKDIYNYLEKNENKTQFVVMFCHDYWNEQLTIVSKEKQENNSSEYHQVKKTKNFNWYLPCKFENKDNEKKDLILYYILYNMTLAPSNLYTSMDKPMKLDSELLTLKVALDNSVLEIKSKETKLGYIPKINIDLQNYPYVQDRMLRNLDGIAMYGSFYMIMIPLAVFMVIFDELMREKIDNLRRGMQLLGTQDNAYWASWIITSFILSFILSTLTIITGNLYEFHVFTRTPFWVFFILFFLTAEAYISMAFFFSTVVENRSQAFTVNFSVILMSMVTNMILSEPTAMKKVFFNLDNPFWISIATNLFYFNPCFQFGKIFGDITNIVCARFDPQSLNWINTFKNFEYNDIFTEQQGQFFSKDRYKVVPMFDTICTLFYVIIFYGTLAWYYDHTIPSNRGVYYPWYFPFQLSFWLPKLFKNSSKKLLTMNKKQSYTNKVDTAFEETNNIQQEEKKMLDQKQPFFKGLRAIGLSKTYKSMIGNLNTQALKNVFFEIQQGELLGILGHNGAGKSSLINVLCGLVNKDEGNARVFEHNIDESLRQIRKRMGVVSQFDVLWDELTGIEHMQLFQILKRVEIKNFEKLVNQRLDDVGLLDSGNLSVGKYSGGMRRRISVALSTMGNPNVILMDEPTTGMDPVSRRHVWALIQKLKSEKAILMSTHAMEEAELLSDKIIILNYGEVKCVGTPLQLKNMLGNGYRISMICDKQNVSQVKYLMKQIVPSSEYYEQSGDSGGMVFNVPLENVRQIGPIIGMLDNQNHQNQKQNLTQLEKQIKSLKEIVTDIGVSQSTLEEVFMAVTSSNYH